MKKRGLTSTVVLLWIVGILAAILAATYLLTSKYLFLGGKMFPRHQEVLDIRQKSISCEEYERLAWQMPQTVILWNVPFQSEHYPQDTQELTVSHWNEEDTRVLPYFPQLETIHAGNCTDYAALAALVRDCPQLNVVYQVPVGEQLLPSDTESVTVTSITQPEAELLSYLPHLTTVDGSDCRDYAVLAQLQQSHPEWEVIVPHEIAGTAIHPELTTLEVTGADYEELSVGLSAMPALKQLLVRNPAADAEELEKLSQEYPNVELHWEVEACGQTYREDTTELDLSSQPIGSIDRAKEIASRFPKLQKLIVDSGDIPNEDMAAYRDEVRSSYKVVWTVYFTDKCKARTDETYFMPIKQGEYYFQDKHVYNLRFCEDMICIDVGHAPVKDISFVSYMPHLKYLILAWTQVTDITPLSSCKELVYLELDHGIIHDFTPLQGCTALEDLNINDQQWHASIEPLCELKWLKNLWVVDRKYADKMLLTESLPNTRVVIEEVSSATGMGWRNLQNYYDMRDCLGMYYMN